MIRFIVGILFFISVLTASDGISFGHKKRVYTVQLFSLKMQHSKKAILRKIPFKLRDKIHLHKVKNETVACYSQSSSYKNILKDLKKVKQAGYKSAFVITTTRWYMSVKEKNKKHNIKTKMPQLSKYAISQIIYKANKAYKNRNENKAMMYYEMLLAAGVKSDTIKNNLCYLYGKKGAWSQAKDIIDKDRLSSQLIYAYANGAARTLQKNFYNDLHEYIMLDGSGHLALLTGYYFEKNNNLKKAGEFYKLAYEKSRNDLYNIYAYARYLDIIGQKIQAINFYKDIYSKTEESSELHKALKLRLYNR